MSRYAATVTRVSQPTSQQEQEPGLSDVETDRVRRRVRLLVDITSRVAEYRDGLRRAADRLTRHEATIIADLEQHGLDVPQLREVLWGAHVLVDDPDLYEAWRFPKSRERLSSHHKTVDKETYPDLGLKGPLVREKLHGRTKTGTWVQLEKTPAAMGDGFRLPTWNDVLHLCDFVVYRITKSNVGPWGLSKQTERRPLYLSPSLAGSVLVPEAARPELARALQRVEAADDTSSALAALFPPPERASAEAELVNRPGTRGGRGLFGASDVHTDALADTDAGRALRDARTTPDWTLPEAGRTEAITLRGKGKQIRTVVRRVPATEQQEDM